jgi:hypothetical protein
MAEPMSKSERTGLWAIIFGLAVTVGSLALPLSFDVSPYVYRVAFFIGATAAAISAFFIAYENFANTRPNARSRRSRTVAFSLAAIAIVAGAAWGSIFLPTPRPTTIGPDDLKKALFQPPHVVITQAKPTFLSKDDGVRFIVYFTNAGPRAVRGVTIHFGLAFTDGGTFSEAHQETAFAGLENFPLDKNSTDFMEAGMTRNSTLPGDFGYHTPITIDELKEIQQNKGAMLLAVQVSFFDDKTNDVWRAESCQYWDYNVPKELVNHISAHLCIGHNGMVAAERKLNSEKPSDNKKAP